MADADTTSATSVHAHQTRRSGRWIALLAVASMLAACSPTVASHGHRLDEEAVAQIRPGLTSREEVVRLLGSPSSFSTFDDSAWYYVSQRTERKSFYQEEVVEQQVVTISFDRQGTVAGVTRNDLTDAREIEVVERATPTAGNELSILEQFVGNVGRFNVPTDQR